MGPGLDADCGPLIGQIGLSLDNDWTTIGQRLVEHCPQQPKLMGKLHIHIHHRPFTHTYTQYIYIYG